jgi:plastocyanin
VFALVAASAVALSGCSSHPASQPEPTCATVLPTIAPVTDKGQRQATSATIELDAASAAFAPTCVTDVPRGTVTVVVHNTGAVIHNFEIAAQHIDVDIKPRQSATIHVTVGSAPVVFVCKYHRALGMVGVFLPVTVGRI